MSLTDTSSAKASFVRAVGVPSTPAWQDLPFTSESLSEKLTSAQSAAMRDDRQFAGSRLVRGESSGDIGLELAYGQWFDDILQGVLQASAPLPLAPISGASDTITNGKTKVFFAFEKKLEAETGFQYMRFFDTQMGMLTIDVQSNSLASMTLGVIGLNSANDTSIIAGATYTPYDLDDQMDTNSAVLEFTDLNDVAIPVTAQSLSLALDNQMRGQQAIGYFYNAGNASGRMKVTMSTSVYFRNQDLFDKFTANEGIKVNLTLQDTAGNSYKFAMGNVKVTSHDIAAGGADQDLLASIELQAFPALSLSDKTIAVTRTTA